MGALARLGTETEAVPDLARYVVSRFVKRSRSPRQSERGAARGAGGAPTIIAELNDGPLAGRRIEAEVVEGRPPKTIALAAPDGSTCRYCLAHWEQAGRSAAYTFLYRVE